MTSSPNSVSQSEIILNYVDNNVPEHLSVLFLSTIEENKLGETVARGFKNLLLEHQHA